jgi:hypothetical protein
MAIKPERRADYSDCLIRLPRYRQPSFEQRQSKKAKQRRESTIKEPSTETEHGLQEDGEFKDPDSHSPSINKTIFKALKPCSVCEQFFYSVLQDTFLFLLL